MARCSPWRCGNASATRVASRSQLCAPKSIRPSPVRGSGGQRWQHVAQPAGRSVDLDLAVVVEDLKLDRNDEQGADAEQVPVSGRVTALHAGGLLLRSL